MKRKLSGCLFVVLLLSVLVASSEAQAWPQKLGAYVAKSSKALPAFPKKVSMFRFSGRNMNYFGESFASSGTFRVFGGETWSGISDGATDFPYNQNSCSNGRWMIRWRSSSPNASLRSTADYSAETARGGKAGSFGYMYGTNCEQPLFRITDNSFVDIYYELKFWEAAP